jgi:hypothetical protein
MKAGRIAVLLIAAVALVAAGCGGSDDSSDTVAPAASAAASTDGAAAATDTASTEGGTATSSATDVATGLQAMVTVAADAATKTVTDPEAGKTAAEGLEEHWAPIEDTVKANDPDTYVEIEDSMEALGSGDTAKAADGSTRLAAAITAYLAAHPG